MGEGGMMGGYARALPTDPSRLAVADQPVGIGAAHAGVVLDLVQHRGDGGSVGGLNALEAALAPVRNSNGPDTALAVVCEGVNSK